MSRKHTHNRMAKQPARIADILVFINRCYEFHPKLYTRHVWDPPFPPITMLPRNDRQDRNDHSDPDRNAHLRSRRPLIVYIHIHFLDRNTLSAVVNTIVYAFIVTSFTILAH
jgi:hypothetical protein